MELYHAGLAAAAGERARWAEEMGRVLAEDGSNPYYSWFAAGMSAGTPH